MESTFFLTRSILEEKNFFETRKYWREKNFWKQTFLKTFREKNAGGGGGGEEEQLGELIFREQYGNMFGKTQLWTIKTISKLQISRRHLVIFRHYQTSQAL